MNLAVTDAIKGDGKTVNLVTKVKLIVAFFKSSVLQTNTLKELCSQKGTFHKLKQDYETRWNSTFDMLERYIVLHEEITTILATCGKTRMCLGHDEEQAKPDIDILKEVTEVLRPFKEATTELSGENFSTI